MSKLAKLRKAWNYETNVPRCENCASFQKPYVYVTTDSNTKRSHAVCKLGWFTVQPNAICDRWSGSDGTRLEAA